MPGHNHGKISTLDMHTGGEPLRIVIEGFPDLGSIPVLDARRRMQEEYDHLRKALMWEPRGHTDMYGAVRIRPERSSSVFGVLFMHNEGYSTMCGHATIALGKAAVDFGWVEVSEPFTSFKIDAPCGQIAVAVEVVDGKAGQVSFENVPSFYLGSYDTVLDNGTAVHYDLAYGGAFYAYLAASQMDLDLESSGYSDLVEAGRRLKHHLIGSGQPVLHPYNADLGFLYGVIFTGDPSSHRFHSRNVCVFADGEVDRSATGSGISGRAAIEHAHGRLPLNRRISIESITGSHLDVELVKTLSYGPYQAVIPKVSGKAYYIGRNEWWLDPEDPFVHGFLLR